ncbi:MAG: type II secretion system F family protein [Planctomycetes bacterium]|nr:type II secretion system F family protein [Planctomycetota bacterium]
MTLYEYAARERAGRAVRGQVAAGSREEVLSLLRARDLAVVRVKPASQGLSGLMTKLRGARSFTGRVKRTELSMFTRQLSTMLAAGLALLEALDVLSEQSESQAMRKVAAEVGGDVRNGADLSAALESREKTFGALYISMVRAGEASGQMDQILERLADHLEEGDKLRSELRSALTYPVVSLGLVVSITAFLLIGVVPGFRDVFESLDSDLPAITTAVLGLSDSIREQWFVCLGVLALPGVIFWLTKRTVRGGELIDRASLRLPVIGEVLQQVALARFSRTFSTLIRAGVPILGALDIVADTSGNRAIARAVRACSSSVQSGNSLAEPLSRSSLFPPMVSRMVGIGERTGSLEALLEKIGEFYEGRVRATVSSLTSLIEPILIAVMGVLVGGVVLAVFLPILDIVGELGASG